MPLKIGIIGLDTSHVSAFAKLLNDTEHEYYVPGGNLCAAYPGGSHDFELSWSRVPGFQKELTELYAVRIVDSPEAVAEQSDAVLLLSVDGRVHLEQLSRIAPIGRPVFVDKPFAINSIDALKMADLSKTYRFPLMSCSALRYSEALNQTLQMKEHGNIIGADFYGPMEIQPVLPGFYWYGIHAAEMLYRTLGTGCVQVSVTTNHDYDLAVGVWSDGRVGTIRGNRKGNKTFGGLVHHERGSLFVDNSAYKKPFYANLLERIMEMFASGKPDVDILETLEIVRFLEAANESRATGKTVTL
ncbi:MAG: oxidoreductase [Bacilli bacterium]|nr:oxidoreductase [Bacilli bacterium]